MDNPAAPPEPTPPPVPDDAAALFFQHSQDLFALFEAGGERVVLNPAWEAVSGWSLDYIERAGFRALTTPAGWLSLTAAVGEAQAGRTGMMKTPMRTRSGDWRWLKGRCSAAPDGRVVAVLRDVTAEEHDRAELEDGRRTRLLLSRAAGIGSWSYEPDGDRVQWSPEILAITGYAAEEMVSTPQFQAICHPDERDDVGAVFTKGVVSGKPASFEHRLRTRDGRWTKWRATFHTEPRPNGVFALKGLSQEITELTEARDRAMRSEQQARLLVELAPFAIAMCDKRLRCMEVSRRLIDVFDLAARKVVGRRLDQILPRAGRGIVQAQRRALAGEVLLNAEQRFAAPDGEPRWMRWEVRPWRDASGEIGGVMTYLDDITDLVTARHDAQASARALKAALNAAQGANEAKASFLANMSHEIRTPMNGVLGVLHLLKREALSPDGLKLLEEAVACGHMLAELLNDVLDFSKIEAGRLELDAQPVQPDAIARGVVRLLEQQAVEKGLTLRLEGGLGEAWRLADPVRLRQTLFNLVGNAVKFTLDGGVVVRSRLIESDCGGRVRFEIEDTGVGIAPEAQAGLFQRFTQADSSTTRRFGGSGLGLSITRKLAELMGGDVGLTSTLGAGSTFWIEIAAPKAQAPADVMAEDGAWLEGLRLLVVEDNATNRLIARKLLENLGASVATAENGISGVAAAAAGGFDLILMDVQMPDIDGLEATRRIRALPGPVAATPILALTANVLSHQRQAYMAAGMNGLVGKPIVPSALLAEIARLAGDGGAMDMAANG